MGADSKDAEKKERRAWRCSAGPAGRSIRCPGEERNIMTHNKSKPVRAGKRSTRPASSSWWAFAPPVMGWSG
jgi:hypothetical protein